MAYSYGLHNVHAGDEIVITISEHHSNLVPWQFVAKTKGATLKYIYLEKDGNLSDEDIETKITEKTKIVAVTQVSNVLGLKNDVQDDRRKGPQRRRGLRGGRLAECSPYGCRCVRFGLRFLRLLRP